MPSAGPCGRFFCFIFAKTAQVMNRLFRSYHFGIKLFSGICLVLFPLAEMMMTGALPGLPTLLVAESGGVSILLMLPQPDECAKPGFFSSLLVLAVVAACHFTGIGHGATVLAVMLLTLLHLANSFRVRYSRVQSLFRQQIVWYAMEGQARLVYALAFSVLALAGTAFSFSSWVMVPDLLALAMLYVLLLITSRSGRILLLRSDREKAVRQIVSSGLREQLPALQRDDAASMRGIYGKVVSIMESARPFLDEEYSLNDLSMAVYTNKTYLSKTINVMSGKNFRQFINGYRVKYSIEMLKKNPRLRVDELAAMSGFHSTVTYTMAFKANMHETPGEYSQRLRSNLI